MALICVLMIRMSQLLYLSSMFCVMCGNVLATSLPCDLNDVAIGGRIKFNVF